jgi:two-component system, response regulator / RNA-binding antiterminator
MTVPLKLLIVDPDDERRDRLLAALKRETLIHAIVVNDTLGVHALVDEFDPDMVIVAAQTAARDSVEDLRGLGAAASGGKSRPVVMLVERLSAAEAEDALRAGVTAYVVEDLDLARIRRVMDLATAQFRVFGELRRNLDRAHADLADRKTIERAKGLLMKRRQLDEDAAYKLLRAAAMNQGRPIAAICKELLAAEALLGGGDL